MNSVWRDHLCDSGDLAPFSAFLTLEEILVACPGTLKKVNFCVLVISSQWGLASFFSLQ